MNSNTQQYYVYLYFDPINQNIPFYVGKGCGNRYRDISGRKYNKPLYNKIQKLRKNGYLLKDITKFEEKNLSENQALDVEIDLIKKWGRKDNKTGILLNRTDGGDGVVNAPSNPLLLPYKDDIIDLYVNKNKTAKEINDIYKCKSIIPIYYILKMFNIPRRVGGKRFPLLPPLKVLIEEYKYSQSINRMCKKYNCDHNFLKNYLINNGVNIRDGRKFSPNRGFTGKYMLSDKTVSVISQYVNERKNINTIAKSFGVDSSVIKRILKQNQICIKKGPRKYVSTL